MTDHVNTIDEAIAQLHALEHALPASDGVRWFNRLYLNTTVALRDYCRSGKLVAPPFLEDLGIWFANRYFDAYQAASSGGQLPVCWSPMFEARHEPRIAPLQFALAGMNAHIGHDLPLGLVAVSEALGVAPAGGSPQHTDFESVNPIMKETEAQTKRWLLTNAIKELDHAVAPVDDTAAVWSIEAAREAAWVHSEVLWHLRESSELTNAYMGVLDRTVAMENRALLLVRGI